MKINNWSIAIVAEIIVLTIIGTLVSLTVVHYSKNYTSKAATSTKSSATITYYCPCNKCCGKHAKGVTSTGKNANKPGVSVDSKVIPYGSTIILANGNKLIADDTGFAMREATKNGFIQIDVRVSNHNKAIKLGKHVEQITIIYPKEK